MKKDVVRRAMESLQKPIDVKPFDGEAVNAAIKKDLDETFNKIRQNVSNIQFVKRRRSIFTIWAEKIKRWF